MTKPKKRKKRPRKWLAAYRRIPLVRRMLFATLLLMFAQYFIVLLAESGQDTLGIDVVHRSVSATLFGYFISAGFSQREAPRPERVQEGDAEGEGDAEDVPEPDSLSPQLRSGSTEDEILQMWAVGCIGILSLALLLIVRNLEALHHTLESDSVIASLSQLRDFAAGSVGFLVSNAQNRSAP